MQSSLQEQIEILANAPDEHIFELLILENIEIFRSECLLTLIDAFHHWLFY